MKPERYDDLRSWACHLPEQADSFDALEALDEVKRLQDENERLWAFIDEVGSAYDIADVYAILHTAHDMVSNR